LKIPAGPSEIGIEGPVDVAGNSLGGAMALEAAKRRIARSAVANTRGPFSGAGIAVPVTAAFEDRDWILTKGSRHRNELPAHTGWVEKQGWGSRADVERPGGCLPTDL
jgi:hypothetical protein